MYFFFFYYFFSGDAEESWTTSEELPGSRYYFFPGVPVEPVVPLAPVAPVAPLVPAEPSALIIFFLGRYHAADTSPVDCSLTSQARIAHTRFSRAVDSCDIQHCSVSARTSHLDSDFLSVDIRATPGVNGCVNARRSPHRIYTHADYAPVLHKDRTVLTSPLAWTDSRARVR